MQMRMEIMDQRIWLLRQKIFSRNKSKFRAIQQIAPLLQIISSSQTSWFDASFPASNNSISWQSTIYTTNKLASYANTKWLRVQEICPSCSLFGTSDYLSDIDQGQVGDCYFLSGITSVAEIDARFKKIFVNERNNSAGLFAFNVFIKGAPAIVVIDSLIPIKSSKTPLFATIGTDQSYWGALIEKAWAKVNGNYEKIGSGYNYEGVEFLTNAPSKRISMTSLKPDTIWKLVKDADDSNYVMNVDTPTNNLGDKAVCSFNLPCQHSYSLLGVLVINAADKSQINLYRIRNPWQRDANFSGKFNDTASIWKTVGLDGKTYARQAGLVIAEDGIVMMTSEEMISAFSSITISYVNDTWMTSWYDKVKDQVMSNTVSSKYYFSLNQTTYMYIRLVPYNSRMYSLNCKTVNQLIILRLKNPVTLKQIAFSSNYENANYGLNFSVSGLAAGNYLLEAYVTWAAGAVKDYSIVILAPFDIQITDSNNKTSRPTSHDFSIKELKTIQPKVIIENKNVTTSQIKTNSTQIINTTPVTNTSILPDITQKGPVYSFTSNLTLDYVKMRNSQSFAISNDLNGYLYGQYVQLIKYTNGSSRYELMYVTGLTTKDKSYKSSVKITSGLNPIIYNHSPKYQICTTSKSSRNSTSEILECICNIPINAYPKECGFAVLLPIGAAFIKSYTATLF
ncbi:calpain family cysteine protease containing protein [Stylonychia lemnae]|uniref:Calpain family cysteine protease containing protein n=1 Tax=Stylonychia lemnae TaxID=5949 RepID=A0A077ZUS6_STYLE|nr:calpain family cysteine protease containing protein [Stylonychia lemnae]|eukprot:CDW73660.1 calpain family cysteine protease containing protein [Stylonychia lemnae]